MSIQSESSLTAASNNESRIACHGCHSGSVGLEALRLTAILALALASCTQAERVVAIQAATGEEGGAAGASSSAGAGGLGLDVWGPFSPPALVQGLVTRTTPIHDPSLRADELEIFLSTDPGAGSQIWTSKRSRADADWTPAAPVAELVSSANDIDPDVSPDGLTLYFSSDRVGGIYRLYATRRASLDEPWDPAELMTGLGDSDLDQGPSVDANGLYMVFASQRGTADIRLYEATRSDPRAAWESVRELSAVNSGHQDQNPALFEDGLALVWSSRRTRGADTSDLFQLDRADRAVEFGGTPTALAELNSELDWEGDPWLSQDGQHIVFVSERAGNIPQIYEAWR